MARADMPAATVIDGRSLRLTSLDKVMYPQTGTTKREVLSYYAAVAPYFIAHASMRPATRKRFVDGVGEVGRPGKVFFEKNLGSGVPSWLQRRGIKHSDRVVTYPLINEPAALVWCAQMGALELHVPQWRFEDLSDEVLSEREERRPDRLVLDLDPGEGAGLDACVEVAQLCKAILDDIGLETVPVTSGSKGIHLYARLDGSQTSEQASKLAHTLARALEADHPKLIVSDMKKSLRGGKVLLDWSQNNSAKTTVAPYSLRGTPTPRVACPRQWNEIEPGLAQLEMYEVIERLQTAGDPMSSVGQEPEAPTRAEQPPRRGATERARERAAAGGTRARVQAGEPAEAEQTPVAETARTPGSPGSTLTYRPMHATMGTIAQVRGDGWAYEVKWDGYRAIVTVRDGEVRLTSRNGIDLTKTYPELQELADCVASDCVLDGEIVVIGPGGVPSFELLQDRPGSRTIRTQLMLFDVLEIDGEQLLAAPYRDRRAALEELVRDATHVHVPPPLPGDADAALQQSSDLRLEGIIAKRVDSPYTPGIKSVRWVKLKHVQTQEAVIVGWSPGSGNRAGTIGSLLLAVPENGRLTYIGKVGSGFTDRQLTEALRRLQKIERRSPQVESVPAADARGARWVSPVYVGEVAYAEWTSTGRLRQPVWKGWRPDKKPAQVRREV
ncbi:non-homologous end-joining DNA ligase [Blastococcus sp. Marseille-P5729]|uniref:non-homologous end-joining DNA ligase n=1 Tax=Blastococcus sp. Marseille-P5729 TaxID=2086582 RepID=UPI0018FE0EF2|nr:non-homologous end-joining DNA ligase [Blastococcus sp. Marseille-P5729]